jgi:hypothetical protein
MYRALSSAFAYGTRRLYLAQTRSGGATRDA